ncbi:MAG: hypothetical protein Q9191_003373 [Dirinaria sp. TL-2023a]
MAKIAAVLRLSRPSLAQHFPLPPPSSTSQFDEKRALDLPNVIPENSFLKPILLPGSERVITRVKMAAEMQAPSGTVPLDIAPPDEDIAEKQTALGGSLQKIVRFDLREEGTHVLAVSLSYSENTMSKDNSASSGRVRTFRKLYQFVSQPCLSVRTKISDFPPTPAVGTAASCYALEAQLENVADGSITLEQVQFNPKRPFRSTSLNWDFGKSDLTAVEAPVLVPRDVVQVAFMIEQEAGGSGNAQKEMRDGRIVLGQLSMRWRTAMGDEGILNTGWLMTKKT